MTTDEGKPMSISRSDLSHIPPRAWFQNLLSIAIVAVVAWLGTTVMELSTAVAVLNVKLENTSTGTGANYVNAMKQVESIERRITQHDAVFADVLKELRELRTTRAIP